MRRAGASSRAVLFDLGNTLVSYYRASDFAPILRQSIDGLCDFLAERKSFVADRDRAFEHALELNTEAPDYRVRPLEDRLSEIFSASELFADDLTAMCEIFLDPILRLGTLDEHALPTIEAIRRDGMRTAIVSNTPWGSSAGMWSKELSRHGLTDAVDATVFCVDVGWRKPARQIFEHALCLLGVNAENSVFVGDNQRQDVAGALQSGLRAILIDPRGAPAEARCPVIHNLTELLPLLDEIAAE